MDESRENNRGELSPLEMKQVVGIIDLGPKHLDKITPQNIDSIIAGGEKVLRDRRAAINQFRPDQSTLELMATKAERSSGSHAIQCAVNATADARAYVAFLETKNIPAENGDRANIINFFNEFAGWNETMAKLFAADIARRIGEEKKDPQFFEAAFAKLEALTKPILGIVETFAKENAAKIEVLGDTEKTEVSKYIAELTQALAAPSQETMASGLYEKVCLPLSTLIRYQYEEFNKDGLMESAERLTTEEFTETERSALKLKAVEGKVGWEKTAAEFIFDHGFTSTVTKEFEEPQDRMINLLKNSTRAAKDFLDNSAPFKNSPHFDRFVAMAEKKAPATLH